MRETTHFDSRRLIGNFVYDHASISRLSAFITNLLGVGSIDTGIVHVVNAMHEMVERYTKNFSHHKNKDPATTSLASVVLVTGTTGIFGSHILAQLISHPDISRVYAFNRKDIHGRSLEHRQKDGLINNGVDGDILESEKVVLLEGDLLADNFGLDDTTYREVRIARIGVIVK